MNENIKVGSAEEILILKNAIKAGKWEVDSLAKADGKHNLMLAKSIKFDAFTIFEDIAEYAIGDKLKLSKIFFDKVGAHFVADEKEAWKTYDDFKNGRLSPEDYFKKADAERQFKESLSQKQECMDNEEMG